MLTYEEGQDQVRDDRGGGRRSAWIGLLGGRTSTGSGERGAGLSSVDRPLVLRKQR